MECSGKAVWRLSGLFQLYFMLLQVSVNWPASDHHHWDPLPLPARHGGVHVAQGPGGSQVPNRELQTSLQV